jgi:hypothetical protein
MTPSRRIDLPPHRFEHPRRWCCHLQGIKKYNFRVASNGITSILNFMKIRSAVLTLLYAYRRTDVQRERNRRSAGKTGNFLTTWVIIGFSRVVLLRGVSDRKGQKSEAHSCTATENETAEINQGRKSTARRGIKVHKSTFVLLLTPPPPTDDPDQIAVPCFTLALRY